MVQLFNIHYYAVPVLLLVGVVNLTSCLFSHNGVSDEQEAMEEDG